MTNNEGFDFVVAIGASAGGFVAVQELLKELPSQLAVPIIIAVHSDQNSMLTESLTWHFDLPIKKIQHGETIKKGIIYITPGARHVIFKNKTLELSDHVSDSGFRPSIDAMFMTLAAEYREKAIGIVLSGTMKDGMRGAQIIYDMGGQTLVQDPKDALYTDMPKSVIHADHPEKILSAKDLGQWIVTVLGTQDK